MNDPLTARRALEDKRRAFLLIGIWAFIAILVLVELLYSMRAGGSNLRANLRSFSLFDAGPIVLAGVVSGLYFGGRAKTRKVVEMDIPLPPTTP